MLHEMLSEIEDCIELSQILLLLQPVSLHATPYVANKFPKILLPSLTSQPPKDFVRFALAWGSVWAVPCLVS